MLIHKGTEQIETERLILRRFEMKDAEDMFRNWAADEEVCKFLSWNPHSNISETEQIVESWINSYEANYYNWAIELKELGQVIGQLSLVGINEKYSSCMPGYNIGRSFWGKGFMTEALRAVIIYMLKDIGMNRIEARHNTLNIASGMVMKKAGMKFEGILRQVKVDKHGNFYDLAVYSTLKSDLE
ncbi:GNAT family N-acetyltransferase [Clostridium sp. C8-1-8]|uniref:GNAT family N-acetyltransferase n=1 Tax=Clostridium sp. C8-1-8 TaxID=2698831 RepID=UPI00136807D3|nr:GNAT family N-acetyltransferase [Clostridium sp. C8-1-8]